MTEYYGKPDDMTGRIEQELRCYELLDALGIDYSRCDHEAADSIELCMERARVLNTRICKNLFLCNRQETSFYMLCMPADKRFKTSVVSAQLGVARLHFADEEYMTRFLDLHPGSVSVLGLMNDSGNKVRLLLDREILRQEYFACHPCINTSSLKFKTSDLLEKLLPAIRHEPTIVEL